MKCQLCDATATRIANLEKHPINWEGAKPDYARTGIIVMCESHIRANTFNAMMKWEKLEYMTEYICPKGHRYEAHESDNPTCPTCAEEAPKTSSVAKPTETAMNTIMKILRAHANPDNHYFIDNESGELVDHCYCDKDSFISGQPKNSYELCLGKRSSRSYKILNEAIMLQWKMAEDLDKMMKA